MNSVAVDTNVLIFFHDENDGRKRGIAKSLLADNPKISSQVVSEYLNTTRKLLTLSYRKKTCFFKRQSYSDLVKSFPPNLPLYTWPRN